MCAQWPVCWATRNPAPPWISIATPSTKTNASPGRNSARRWGCKEAYRRQSLAYTLNGPGIVSLSAGSVQTGVQRQHILPGAVEKSHLPPPVGAGEPHFARRLQIRFYLRRAKACSGQAVGQAGAEQPGQVGPEQPRHIKADKGVPAVALHGQQAVAAPQLDNMQIPAEVPADFAAVGRRLLVQKPLQGKDQSQFHQFTSW